MYTIDLNMEFKGACAKVVDGEIKQMEVNYLMPVESLHILRYFGNNAPFEGMVKRDDGQTPNIDRKWMKELEKYK